MWKLQIPYTDISSPHGQAYSAKQYANGGEEHSNGEKNTGRTQAQPGGPVPHWQKLHHLYKLDILNCL